MILRGGNKREAGRRAGRLAGGGGRAELASPNRRREKEKETCFASKATIHLTETNPYNSLIQHSDRRLTSAASDRFALVALCCCRRRSRRRAPAAAAAAANDDDNAIGRGRCLCRAEWSRAELVSS